MNAVTSSKIDRIAWPTDSGFVFTDRADVVRCQADGSYTKVYFTDGAKIVISHKIKVVEQLLGGAPFFRIHESHLVNLRHTTRIIKKDGAWFMCIADVEIPVAKARQKALIKNFHTLHEAKMALSDSKAPSDEVAVDI